jgi:hypothetical protein
VVDPNGFRPDGFTVCTLASSEDDEDNTSASFPRPDVGVRPDRLTVCTLSSSEDEDAKYNMVASIPRPNVDDLPATAVVDFRTLVGFSNNTKSCDKGDFPPTLS